MRGSIRRRGEAGVTLFSFLVLLVIPAAFVPQMRFKSSRPSVPAETLQNPQCEFMQMSVGLIPRGVIKPIPQTYKLLYRNTARTAFVLSVFLIEN